MSTPVEVPVDDDGEVTPEPVTDDGRGGHLVALVTGASRGIGKAIAERAVAEGARVLVHGIERHDGEKLVAQLGAHAALHLDDLIDPASPKRIAAAAVAAFGRIDAVVNNAAIVVGIIPPPKKP